MFLRVREDIGRSARVVDELITELRLGWIRTVAFVVLGEASWTLPLYRVAITTARRGWTVGISDARYWFITSEPVPLAGFGATARAAISAELEPEGITFIGSTFADLRPGVVLLDPQGEASRSIASSRSRTCTDSATRREKLRRWEVGTKRRLLSRRDVRHDRSDELANATVENKARHCSQVA